MNRIYDVDIKMTSVISALSEHGEKTDTERGESEARARLQIKDGEPLTLLFRERGEGGDVTTEIAVSESNVIVRRRGAIISDMLFCEGKKTKSVYKIPPYSFDMEIDCKHAKIKIGDKEGRVDLLYTMNVGGDIRSARMKIIWN